MDALIGSTGFVGSNLRTQHEFGACFHSPNISDAAGRSFDVVVCAGVQAKKWWAAEHPDEDWRGIQRLLDVLSDVRAEAFVLISTVDVYPTPVNVTESTSIESNAHPYGRHRLAVEEFVRERFARHHVLRLPGLFGRHLRKNVIFDLLTNNQVDRIQPGSSYQYYWLEHLWADIERCRRAGLALLNIATEPLRTDELIARCFPERRAMIDDACAAPVARYDMRTDHAALWESTTPGYLYDRESVLREIESFAADWRSSAGLQ